MNPTRWVANDAIQQRSKKDAAAQQKICCLFRIQQNELMQTLEALVVAANEAELMKTNQRKPVVRPKPNPKFGREVLARCCQ
jgi:hypothetical protein